MNAGIKLSEAFLKRCPACMKNFVQNICDFTCDAHQSNFIDVKKTEPSDYPGNNKQIIYISIFMIDTCREFVIVLWKYRFALTHTHTLFSEYDFVNNKIDMNPPHSAHFEHLRNYNSARV